MMFKRKFFNRTWMMTAIILMISIPLSLRAQSVTLYTPYTRIAVPPGESISYKIDVINNGKVRHDVDLSISGMPKDWSYTMKSGGWNIQQLSVLPGGKKTVSLEINVPFKVKKGRYRFRVNGRGFYSLPLTVVVSKQGTYKTEFTTKQANMQGHGKSSFTFSTELKNLTGEKQRYALKSFAPRGWIILFKPGYKQATSVEVQPNNTSSITVEVRPPHMVEAGTYKIPVQAVTSSTSASLELEVVITGNFKMEFSTPTGLLSTSITAGSEKRVKLIVQNTGSAKLKDIKFRSTNPPDWEVTFEPDKIDELEPGKSSEIVAVIKAGKNAIPGDYVTKLTAHTPEVSSTITFRISVKTPMLMGWIGIFIIFIALGSLYYLFRKYGRR